MVKLHIFDEKRRKLLELTFVIGIEKRAIQGRDGRGEFGLRLNLLKRHTLRPDRFRQKRQPRKQKPRPANPLHQTPLCPIRPNDLNLRTAILKCSAILSRRTEKASPPKPGTPITPSSGSPTCTPLL